MNNVKGLATVAVMGIVIVVCLVAAIVSDKYLGPGNPVEKDAEQIIEQTLEAELHG